MYTLAYIDNYPYWEIDSFPFFPVLECLKCERIIEMEGNDGALRCEQREKKKGGSDVSEVCAERTSDRLQSAEQCRTTDAGGNTIFSIFLLHHRSLASI